MTKKKPKKIAGLPWDFSDFKWCIENDFQVYPITTIYGKYKIAIRRGGISSEGKDRFINPNGVEFISNEAIGQMEFKDLNALSDHLPSVYKQLRIKYEKQKRTITE
jgi:hypothetical protein